MEIGLAFLGLSERSAYVRDGNTNLFKWNILGLKQHILTHIFPVTLDGWFLTLALKATAIEDSPVIKIYDKDNIEIGKIELKQGEVVEQRSFSSKEEGGDGVFVLIPDEGWVLLSVPLMGSSINIYHPGEYTLKVVHSEERISIGKFNHNTALL